jgi:hypothetical protein
VGNGRLGAMVFGGVKDTLLISGHAFEKAQSDGKSGVAFQAGTDMGQETPRMAIGFMPIQTSGAAQRRQPKMSTIE